MLKVQFFLVESISIGKLIRGGRGGESIYRAVKRCYSCGVLPVTGYFYSKRNHYITREERISWLERIFGRGGGGGGDSSLYKPYRYVHAASSGRVLGLFGLKTGTLLVYFALESGMVLKGTRDNMNVFIVSIPNDKNEIEVCDFELHLKIFLVCRLI